MRVRRIHHYYIIVYHDVKCARSWNSNACYMFSITQFAVVFLHAIEY